MFCESKNTNKRVKKQPTNGKIFDHSLILIKIFYDSVTDKTILKKERTKDLNRHFRKDLWPINMKRGSLLVIWEMQIKTTMRYNFIPTRWP